jgi:hypothetical protein
MEPGTPFHLRYSLSRAQRFVPHLRIWGMPLTLLVVGLFGFFCVMAVMSAWLFNVMGLIGFGVLAVFLFVLFRGLLVGLLDVLLVPVRNMDVIIEENAAGILLGGERWYLFLDGITRIDRFRDDTWTIQHCNGSVLHIAAAELSPEQLAYIRAAMERSRTPEGVRAVIERGQRIQAILDSEQKTPGARRSAK